MPFLLRVTLSIPEKKKSPIFCLLLPFLASFTAADVSQIWRIWALIVSCTNWKMPLLCSLAGMGYCLNQAPLAYAKKSSPGTIVVSMCAASASGTSTTAVCLHEVVRPIRANVLASKVKQYFFIAVRLLLSLIHISE